MGQRDSFRNHELINAKCNWRRNAHEEKNRSRRKVVALWNDESNSSATTVRAIDNKKKIIPNRSINQHYTN